MSCGLQQRRTANASRGPLKAYYDPTKQAFSLVSRDRLQEAALTDIQSKCDPISYPFPTYWTDSDDGASEASSAPSFEIPLTHTSTLKRPMRSLCGDIRSHFPISTANQSPGKSTRVDTTTVCLSPPKRICVAHPHSPLIVSMGMGVKQIPSYYRRRSMGDAGENASTANPSLAPICPVPIPAAFADRINDSIEPIFPLRKSVETQTTPPSSPYRQSRRSRRSSASDVISSLRKTFSHIKRAASADRKTIQIPPFTHIESPQTPKIRRNRDMKDREVKFTMLKRFGDNSRLVQMKRASIATPFGIFIASDPHGLFISRKLDQDYLDGCEKLVRIGDRVLQVQGVVTKGLDVTTVQGLLQGCQLATLRLKSIRSLRRHSNDNTSKNR